MTTLIDVKSLYKARPRIVGFVDVPEFAFVVVKGSGEPEGPGFAEAIQALFTVSYGAHFLVKKAGGDAPRVMPLEALWWVPGVPGAAAMTAPKRTWEWQAMIMQLPPIDAHIVEEAITQAKVKHLPALERVRFLRWSEGRCAQVMHIGPYAEEAPTIERLHAAIEAAGLRLRGRHHEIYLGDPRRAAPEKLKTILRQPVETEA